MEPPIIIKIAGAVITDKKSSRPKANIGNMRAIAKTLKDFHSPYILVHGAGSFGHPLAKKSGVDKTVISKEQLLAFARIQGSQNRLNYIFCNVLIDMGIPAFPAQVSSHAVMERGRLVKINVDATFGLMRLGMVPVSYGVPAFDRIWGSSILSYDQIAHFMAKNFGAHKIIDTEDVNGVFTTDPKIDKNARLIPLINETNCADAEKCLTGSTAIDVTGGMKQKYLELIEAAKTGIVCQVVHFKVLKDALEGRPVGTMINFKQ